ncbi:MAG: CRTAC1 family protein [Candidatus Entotheonellia bacterium]
MKAIMRKYLSSNINYHNTTVRSFIALVVMLLVVCLLAVDKQCDASQITTFTDISVSSGVKIFRPTYGNPLSADFNKDGFLDIFVSNHTDMPSLFQNNGNGTFIDIRSESGISTELDRHGAAWGDYDNDGNVDLFITVGAARGEKTGEKTDQLYKNDGTGIVTDVTAAAGVINASGRGRSVNWVDFNSDGYLDLFVKNSKTPNVLYQNNGDGTFTDVAVRAEVANAPGDVSSWADFNADGYPDLFITSGASDQLWKNNGDGTFMEVTSAAGIRSVTRGEGVAWGDYNNDGHLDLYIAKGYHDVEDALSWDGEKIAFSDQESDAEDGLDFTTSGDQVTFDLYLQNCRQAGKTFVGSQRSSPPSLPFTLTEVEAAGRPFYTPGIELGFFIWHDSNGWHLRWTANGPTTYFYGKMISNGQFTSVQPLNFMRRTPSVKSILYKNNGDGTFTDVTELAGVGSTKNNRGAIWGDYDNDGYLDLYVVNSGSFERNKANILYRNKGDGTFENVTGMAQVWSSVNGRGDGAAWMDINNDGFLDLYVTNGWGQPILARQGSPDCLMFGPHILYQNNGNGNRWLKIKLVGVLSNRDAVGAKVTLQANGLTQFREVNGGGGGQFFSQGSGPIHFGLGQADTVDLLTIHWPSGITQTLTNINVNRDLTVVEESVSP